MNSSQNLENDSSVVYSVETTTNPDGSSVSRMRFVKSAGGLEQEEIERIFGGNQTLFMSPHSPEEVPAEPRVRVQSIFDTPESAESAGCQLWENSPLTSHVGEMQRSHRLFANATENFNDDESQDSDMTSLEDGPDESFSTPPDSPTTLRDRQSDADATIGSKRQIQPRRIFANVPPQKRVRFNADARTPRRVAPLRPASPHFKKITRATAKSRQEKIAAANEQLRRQTAEEPIASTSREEPNSPQTPHQPIPPRVEEEGLRESVYKIDGSKFVGFWYFESSEFNFFSEYYICSPLPDHLEQAFERGNE